MPINEKIYCVKEQFVSNPGDRFRPIYTPDIDDAGNITLVQTGVEDLQEIYNSQRDSCDVSVLASRFLAGDESALQRGNPVFLDLLGVPNSLMEAYQLQFRAEQAFNNLPVEIRERFHQNFGEFLAGAGTPEWFDALKIPGSIVNEPTEKESGTSES